MNLLNTFFNIPILIETFPLLLSGLLVTLEIGITSIVAGLAGGLFLALVRLYGAGPFPFLAKIYIDIFRSIPLLVLLIVVYYALPFVGIRFSPFVSAVVALTLVSSAYTAEIFRAGIEAIPHGQFEASQALGLSGRHMMIDVIPAAGHQDRHSTTDQQLHQRPQGHRPRLCRRHARPPETGHPGAGPVSQSDAADRCGPHLCCPALAAGQHRGAP